MIFVEVLSPRRINISYCFSNLLFAIEICINLSSPDRFHPMLINYKSYLTCRGCCYLWRCFSQKEKTCLISIFFFEECQYMLPSMDSVVNLKLIWWCRVSPSWIFCRNVSQTGLSGSVPTGLLLLGRLRVLDISKNRFSGVFIPPITMNELEYLFVLLIYFQSETFFVKKLKKRKKTSNWGKIFGKLRPDMRIRNAFLIFVCFINFRYGCCCCCGGGG